ncbi:hypothetical protein K1719_044278 [Acacia pycnantha]|nr:hypothetical protein K1719_044278 [Acacia pycnantha]
MVCACLNLNELRLIATRLEDSIVFTLFKRTMYSYNRSLYNMHASLDYENEEGMLRRVVSKIEHLQAAFRGFKVPEKVPFFQRTCRKNGSALTLMPQCRRTHWSWTQLPLPSIVTASYDHSTT